MYELHELPLSHASKAICPTLSVSIILYPLFRTGLTFFYVFPYPFICDSMGVLVHVLYKIDALHVN